MADYRLDGDNDGTLRIWHFESEEYIMELPPPESFAVAMTYNHLMAAESQRTADYFVFGYVLGFAHAVTNEHECREIENPRMH